LNFLRISKFNTTPVDKETDNSWTGYHQIFSRLREAVTFLLLLHSVLLETDGVDVDEPGYTIIRVLRGRRKENTKLYLGQLTGIDGAKIDKAVHG
jgi:hypothetical protein